MSSTTKGLNLTIAWLYPELMSTYGDRGNIICLTQRCQWRGIQTSVQQEIKGADLIFMGGAQDRQQKIVAQDFLGTKAKLVKKMVENGIPALFVCAAYQFVGYYYRPYQGADIPGAGIFDLYTVHPGDQAKRLIGNTVAKLLDTGQTIVGFENHGGRTTLGPKMKPLAKVLKGFGNNGSDGFEGATFRNAIGSYFHGPLLPKNPHLADWLIQKALEVKYNKKITLAPLDDTLEWQAHKFIVNKYGH